MRFPVVSSPELVTIVLGGELDLLTTRELSEQLAEILAGKPARLAFDMAAVEFLDCAAARVIALAGRSLPGGLTLIRRPTPATRRILDLTGLAAYCEMKA
jgi:anti-anti-sigma factor